MMDGAVEQHEPYRDVSDEELVRKTLVDQDAFVYIIRRYERKLMRYVVRLTGVSQEDAEDILQESFIKAYRNLNAFDVSLKFSSWMYRIVHNEAVSHVRKRAVRPFSIPEEEFSELVSRIAGEADVERDADLNIMATSIRDALGSLEKKYREVLVLRYLEERDYREISDILRIPEGTVAVRLNRAKKRFRHVFERSGKGKGDI